MSDRLHRVARTRCQRRLKLAHLYSISVLLILLLWNTFQPNVPKLPVCIQIGAAIGRRFPIRCCARWLDATRPH